MSSSAIRAGVSSETFGVKHQSGPMEGSVGGECWESLGPGSTLCLGMRIHGKLEHTSYTPKAQALVWIRLSGAALCAQLTPNTNQSMGWSGGCFKMHSRWVHASWCWTKTSLSCILLVLPFKQNVSVLLSWHRQTVCPGTFSYHLIGLRT